jgi:hypothetical protein
MQYLVRCMLSDLPSFKLPVPHLGQDKWLETTICLIYGIPNT